MQMQFDFDSWKRPLFDKLLDYGHDPEIIAACLDDSLTTDQKIGEAERRLMTMYGVDHAVMYAEIRVMEINDAINREVTG